MCCHSRHENRLQPGSIQQYILYPLSVRNGTQKRPQKQQHLLRLWLSFFDLCLTLVSFGDSSNRWLGRLWLVCIGVAPEEEADPLGVNENGVCCCCCWLVGVFGCEQLGGATCWADAAATEGGRTAKLEDGEIELLLLLLCEDMRTSIRRGGCRSVMEDTSVVVLLPSRWGPPFNVPPVPLGDGVIEAMAVPAAAAEWCTNRTSGIPATLEAVNWVLVTLVAVGDGELVKSVVYVPVDPVDMSWKILPEPCNEWEDDWEWACGCWCCWCTEVLPNGCQGISGCGANPRPIGILELLSIEGNRCVYSNWTIERWMDGWMIPGVRNNEFGCIKRQRRQWC